MELKTKVKAAEGEQELLITREFDLPVELLFKAFTLPELLGEWMGTNVTLLENQNLGKYQFETKDSEGNIVFSAFGAIHKVVENEQIVRTFEMLNAPFDAQFEFLNFKSLGEGRSALEIQMIYKSKEIRSQMLKLPFASGISKAHDRLEKLMSTKK